MLIGEAERYKWFKCRVEVETREVELVKAVLEEYLGRIKEEREKYTIPPETDLERILKQYGLDFEYTVYFQEERK